MGQILLISLGLNRLPGICAQSAKGSFFTDITWVNATNFITHFFTHTINGFFCKLCTNNISLCDWKALYFLLSKSLKNTSIIATLSLVKFKFFLLYVTFVETTGWSKAFYWINIYFWVWSILVLYLQMYMHLPTCKYICKHSKKWNL